ncbi:MAG: RluA family pseudouridine synthase [Alphaproteobacteria bacterium]|nr:RluA family pseudouridine synthase [Alphaproteobacteria bacterium]
MKRTAGPFLVVPDQDQIRLDKFLVLNCPDFSRARLQNLIERGEVLVDEKAIVTASFKLRAGVHVCINIPPPEPSHLQAQEIELNIVYEDDHLLVINKPAGMVVHPGAGNRAGTLVNALMHHCGSQLSGIGGVQRPGIVHRLDKETSGLMLVAKTDQAHQHLAGQLADRTLERVYQAFILGVPRPPIGLIDAPIARHPTQRLKMTVARRDGRAARTRYRVLTARLGLFSKVECRLETGRTHQIRVHMAHLGHPLIGDPLYGAQPTALRAAVKKAQLNAEQENAVLTFPRQALHAGHIA